MGYDVHYDGKCFVCGLHAEEYCDSCRRYICEEHKKKKKDHQSYKYFKICQECYKNPKAEMTHAKRRQVNPSLDRIGV